MNTRDYLPNAPAHCGRFFHVSTTGSDDNRGSADAPFRTINHAASVLMPGDTVVIHEGVYREAVHLTANGHLYFPEGIIRFQSEEHVWLRASDQFTPEWRNEGQSVYSAALPGILFEDGAYNPFALPLDLSCDEAVRPGTSHPVRGLLWADGRVLEYSSALENDFCFNVSTDGRRVAVKLPSGSEPHDFEWEVSIRRKVFYPEFSGPMLYETRGIVVEHAVEPGAFDGAREYALHSYPQAGMTVEKRRIMSRLTADFSMPFRGLARLGKGVYLVSMAGYEGPSELSIFETGTTIKRFTPSKMLWEDMHGIIPRNNSQFHYFPNEGLLYHSWLEHEEHGGLFSFVSGQHWKNYFAESSDGGETWTAKQLLPGDERMYFRIIQLQDGTLLWPYSVNEHFAGQRTFHQGVGVMLGRRCNGIIEWMQGGSVSVSPTESANGLAEPHAAQLHDGRIVMLLRSGARLPDDDSPGVTSGKMYSVSDDGGRTFSKPSFLKYDDGRTVMCPRSYQDIFLSQKNHRLYAVLNIADGPCWNCDPRTHLCIGELDQKSLCLLRDTVVPIEQRHQEHHPLVRFSNWQQTETDDGRLMLFMTIHASENCPIRHGWDKSIYCYMITLPE